MDLTNAIVPNPFRGTAVNGQAPAADQSAGGLSAFDAADAAPESAPLPPGIYLARVVCGEVCQTRAGADAYRMRFEVSEGPQAGKSIIRIWTFSPRALPYSKRDLAVFGLTTSADLLSPFPPAGREIIVRLTVAMQRGADGIERNDVKRIEVIRTTDSPAARFLLPPGGPGGSEGGPHA